MEHLTGLLEGGVLVAATPRDLLATYEAILFELRAREVVRTDDAPVGQYAEWLSHRALGGELMPNNVKSYDLLTPEGHKVQVKARVLRHSAASADRQLSPFRSFEFDWALVILFGRDYSVRRATRLATDVVFEQSKHQAHVNGRVVMARDSCLDLGVDMTASLERAGRG